MEIIRGLENLKKSYPNIVLTIGNFDGVHIGHRKIFLSVVERAKEISGTPVAITFEPHPIKVIAPERGIRILTPFEEKARLIEASGIEVLLCIAFNSEFSNLPPDNFIEDMLVRKLHVKEVIVGHNYAFGKGKKGTTELLRRRGKRYGFGVKVVRNAKIYGDVVSSSRIRSLIYKGRVCEAAMFLGRPYTIEGIVVKGAGRGGKLLNTPTANITTPDELVPKEGVYAVKVTFDGDEYEGVANIGRNPTFGGSRMSYEVHIFDFSGDLLGKNLRIHFIDRIRDEQRFSDVKTLETQIKKDIEKAKAILRTKT